MTVPDRDAARQAAVMLATEEHREALAVRHEARAERAQTRIADLRALATATGLVGGTREGGPCPTCGARRGEPCTDEHGHPLQGDHVARAGSVGEDASEHGRASTRRCSRCGARPGAPCVSTRTGQPIRKTHPERLGTRELERTARWHELRAKGQRERPKNLEGCGGQMIATSCACGGKGRARPRGCGNYRTCPRCAERKAIKQRSRFGRARGRVLLDALRNVPGRGAIAGTRARWRRGGRYTDKMITLTLPHFDGAELFESALEWDASGAPGDERRAANARRVLGHGSETIRARIAACFDAFPVFARLLRAHLRQRGHGDHLWSKWDRNFEWTPGSDQNGHPHFHVWFFGPWICHGVVAELWTAAVRATGVPLRTRERECEHCGRAHTVGAIAHVMQLGDFDERAVRELMAGGKAIELSAFRSMNIGPNAVTYAGGWAMSDVMGEIDADTEASVYCALEGRRLAQGCAGLYRDDAPPACPCCGAMASRHVLVWSAADESRTDAWNQSVKRARAPDPDNPNEERERALCVAT